MQQFRHWTLPDINRTTRTQNIKTNMVIVWIGRSINVYRPAILDQMHVPSNLNAWRQLLKITSNVASLFVRFNNTKQCATGFLSLLHVIYKILDFVDPKVNVLNNVFTTIAVKTARRCLRMKHLSTHRSSRNTFQPQNRTKIELHI